MRNIEEYTNEYLKPSFEEYEVKFRRKKVLEIIEKLQPKSILEIGCGMEPIFKYIDVERYERILTVEPSKVFYENAQFLSKNNTNVHCVNAFFEEYVSKIKEEYDFVLCSGLLCELEDQDRMLEAIKRVCENARNTTVHINVSNANSVHRLLAKEMGLIEDIHEMSERNKQLQQHSVYDMTSLCEIVCKHGFTIIDKGSYFLKFLPHDKMMDMVKNQIITDETLEGMYGLTKLFPEYGAEIYVNIKL